MIFEAAIKNKCLHILFLFFPKMNAGRNWKRKTSQKIRKNFFQLKMSWGSLSSICYYLNFLFFLLIFLCLCHSSFAEEWHWNFLPSYWIQPFTMKFPVRICSFPSNQLIAHPSLKWQRFWCFCSRVLNLIILDKNCRTPFKCGASVTMETPTMFTVQLAAVSVNPTLVWRTFDLHQSSCQSELESAPRWLTGLMQTHALVTCSCRKRRTPKTKWKHQRWNQSQKIQVGSPSYATSLLLVNLFWSEMEEMIQKWTWRYEWITYFTHIEP